ncbi:MAG: mhkD [Chlamydiales bacterium]|jgi:hypothetical protein|nr:mhkD [Chlamydiales bacterium]
MNAAFGLKEAPALPCSFQTQPRVSPYWSAQALQEEGVELPFKPLPCELILHLFSFFKEPDLLPLRQVSRGCKALAQDDSLWSKRDLTFDGGYRGLAARVHSKKVYKALKCPKSIPAYKIEWPNTLIANVGLIDDTALSINWSEKIWNLEDGQLKADFKDGEDAHFFSRICVQKQMITAKSWNRIEVADVETREYLYSFKIADEAKCFAASQDCPGQLFIGLQRGQLACWDLTEREEVFCFQAHRQYITALALTDHYIISGSDDRTLKIWQRSNQQLVKTLVKTFEEHQAAISSLTVEGRLLISGDESGTIKIWDLDTLQRLYTVQAHQKYVSTLVTSSGRLFSGSDDGSIKIWNLHTMEQLATLPNEGEGIVDIALTKDKIISATLDLFIYDLSQDIEHLTI